MRKWTELSVAGCFTLIAVAACNDASVNPTAPPPAVAPPSLTTPAVPLGTQIQSEINSLFPVSEASSVTRRWNNVVDELNEAQLVISNPTKYKNEIDSARARLVVTVSYIQSKTYKITPPAGETKDHAAARLVLMMSLYVYNGSDTQPPSFPAGSDVVLAIVKPSATTTTIVRTPTQHAAVQFPPGSVGETRIVVIAQNMTPFPANCSGPLATTLCQYPQFYDFNVFPDNRLLVPAIASVCHINTGSSRAPLADHARFRIAHVAPPNPADRVSGGTIVDGIEILPFVLVSGLTSCTGNSYQVGAASPAPRGPLGSALHWLAEPAARFASAVFGRVAPREAWAIDGLGGGRLSVFSTFATVDPESAPDLDVGVAPSATDVSGDLGNAVQVGAWSVTNTGTATASGVTARVVAATDSQLTTGVIASAVLGQSAMLVPGQALSGTGVTLPLPASMAPGSYYVGIRATLNSEAGLADAYLPNNLQSRRIALLGAASGIWTSRASDPIPRSDAAADAINGTIYVVGGIGPEGLTDVVEAFNAGQNVWSARSPLPVAIQDPAAAALGGKLFVAGGALDPNVTDSYITTSAYSFDPTLNTWSQLAAMSVERMSASGVALNGHFYVVGGATNQGTTGALESYDPAADSWTTLESMPTPRLSAGAAALNGLIYVVGGFLDNTAYTTGALEAYDPATDSWTTLAPMPTPRAELCLEVVGGLLYAVGGVEYGEGLQVVPTVEAYDPQTNSWSARASMPTATHGGVCGVVSGSLYAIGGADATDAVTGAVQRFTP